MQTAQQGEEKPRHKSLKPRLISQNPAFSTKEPRLLEPKITLDGKNLKIRDIDLFINNPEVFLDIDKNALATAAKSREFLEKELPKRIIYGVNTGFGPMASHIINNGKIEQLQENLIRSHATGIGDPIDKRYVLAAMLIRLNTLSKGYSGVTPELLEHLKKFLDLRITPIIPEHGAVGTSGDLVQLAHIALSLIGEGNVVYKRKRQPTAQVLKQLEIPPYKLKAKEGLALINGTSAMSGVAALNCLHAHRLLSLAIRSGAFSLELVHAHKDCISEKLHAVRPHQGQVVVARTLRNTLASSQMLQDRDSLQALEIPENVKEISQVVQEIYSFRCIPQILGPAYDTLKKAQQEVEVEINSSSDNPIVDYEGDNFLHGGNFHGDYISLAMDQLKATTIKLTMLSERRLNFFLHEKLNTYFPPFLNLNQPGLTLGLQGLQFVATSTTSQSQTLAFPQYVHSIPTNADNQDVVSMGMESALLCSRIIENAYIVLAIELIALCQAIDYREKYDYLSNSSKRLYEGIRNVFPKITEDRVLIEELPRVIKFLKSDQNLNLHLDLNEV